MSYANVDMNVIYSELKRIEALLSRVDQKVENFMGFEFLSKEEIEKLSDISKAMEGGHSKSIEQVAKELGVSL